MKIYEKDDSKLVANLELYNWVELSKRYSINAKDELEFLFLFLDKFGIDKVDELKGSYAFAYHVKNQVILMRDIVGQKPICYNKKGDYSTYKKEIEEGMELNPRRFVVFFDGKINVFRRKRYYLSKTRDDKYELAKENVLNLFKKSIKKRLKNKKVGIMFSGGTDSTFIAMMLKELGVDFTCYTASIKAGNIEEGVDVKYAREISKKYGFKWKLCEIEYDEVENITKEIIDIIDDRKYTKICVALPFLVALKEIQKDDINEVFIGIGSEEVFADYKRNVDVVDINEICIEGLKSLWKRDLYRDYSLADYFNISLRFPFLDDDFVNYSIRINPEFKIDKNKGINKKILRDILVNMGLDDLNAFRPKKAAQYGSKSDRIYDKLAKSKNKLKQRYLEEL